MESSVIAGRHAVKELLRSGSDINKIYMQDSVNKSQLKEILDLAKEKRVVVSAVPKSKLDGMTDERHQGIAAMISAHEYMPLEELLLNIEGKDANVIILDGLEDPHNLGSILRTCDAVGFDAVIIPKRRSVLLTDTVAKTSTGAIEYVPVVRVTNINQTIDKLKDHNFWVIGSDGSGTLDYREMNAKSGSTALVVGSEGAGISKKTLEKCDFMVKIPMAGEITSLNASVSAALLMYEVYRQQNPLGRE
ncbi:MAG: 23S rRNA (guanosine(2251)-2'-O)-methyltransferase RlmB [Jeotgalicoccus sp.]|nr:23S rRNA (guanosine(2251)-2'-O)-methyltransferase RlmB [Jeotgalicoccus sp.]